MAGAVQGALVHVQDSEHVSVGGKVPPCFAQDQNALIQAVYQSHQLAGMVFQDGFELLPRSMVVISRLSWCSKASILSRLRMISALAASVKRACPVRPQSCCCIALGCRTPPPRYTDPGGCSSCRRGSGRVPPQKDDYWSPYTLAEGRAPGGQACPPRRPVTGCPPARLRLLSTMVISRSSTRSQGVGEIFQFRGPPDPITLHRFSLSAADRNFCALRFEKGPNGPAGP